MSFASKLAKTITTILLAASCGGRDQPAARQPPRSAGAPVQEARQSLTDCSKPHVVCYTDTLMYSKQENDALGELNRTWIVFATAGDSIVISAFRPGHVDSTAIHLTTSLGQEHDAQKNTLWYYRGRVRTDGVLRVDLSADNMDGGGIVGDSVPYRLRLELPSTSHEQSNNGSAVLDLRNLVANKGLSLIPMAERQGRGDQAAWVLFPGLYTVALTRDSAYELCNLPCSRPDTIVLTAGAYLKKSK